jgi:two-component system phosphate regulon sensor histidine kinase PhoR
MPPAVRISLLLSTGLTLMFVLIQAGFGQVATHTVWQSLIFFAGSLALLVIVLENVVYRRLKNLNTISQREIKRLREIEAYRREFLADVSHELKTPIFAVQGFIHTLMDGAMDDERVRLKFLKKAMKNADRLSGLVQDLLMITQAESGEMELKIKKFPIYDLVSEVLDLLEYKFTKKNRSISWQVIAHGHETTHVLADRERIQQVLTNLVDNAIKYGDANGNVTVELTSADGKLFTHVRDKGQGIEAEHLDKIFRRFYRVDKSRSREKGGTGLGLAICKHLLKMHGEEITVESTVGEGTTFTFSLKLAENPTTGLLT